MRFLRPAPILAAAAALAFFAPPAAFSRRSRHPPHRPRRRRARSAAKDLPRSSDDSGRTGPAHARLSQVDPGRARPDRAHHRPRRPQAVGRAASRSPGGATTSRCGSSTARCPTGADRVEVALDYLSPGETAGFSSGASATAQLALLSLEPGPALPEGPSTDELTVRGLSAPARQAGSSARRSRSPAATGTASSFSPSR